MPYPASKRALDMEQTDRLFREGLKPAEIAARLGVGSPCIRRRLVSLGLWTPDAEQSRRGSKSWDTRPKRQSAGRGPLAAEELRDAPRITRDCCPRCAVRSDIGCRHTRGAWGPEPITRICSL